MRPQAITAAKHRRTPYNQAQLTWAQFITIMATQVRYMTRTTSLFARQQMTAARQRIASLWHRHLEWLDDGDEDIIDITVRQYALVCLGAIVMAFVIACAGN